MFFRNLKFHFITTGRYQRVFIPDGDPTIEVREISRSEVPDNCVPVKVQTVVGNKTVTSYRVPRFTELFEPSETFYIKLIERAYDPGYLVVGTFVWLKPNDILLFKLTRPRA